MIQYQFVDCETKIIERRTPSAVRKSEMNVDRGIILQLLQQRNKRHCDSFKNLIQAHNKLYDNVGAIETENKELKMEILRLKQENMELCVKLESGSRGAADPKRNQKTLEQTVVKLQENLANAQQIIDLNNAVQEKDKELQAKEAKIFDLENKVEILTISNKELRLELDKYQAANQVLQDEQNALNMAFVSLEEKYRKMQEDNNELVSRWMELKSGVADKLNMENESVLKAKQKKIQKELAEAANEHKEVVEPIRLLVGEYDGPPVCMYVTIPERAMQTFDAHEGEVNAIKWSPSGRCFATGGSDRKLKLWAVNNGKCETKGLLTGCNAAIMSVEFDYEEKMVLAASNDFASRVWTLGDQRLRHTLTGHSGKVLTAKFMGDSRKMASGSHDRTIKIWDLMGKACIKTIFAGSICNDLVTLDSSNIISGHFDRKIRFWDVRTDASSNEISLQGRVTALDLSFDKTCLLSCSRDDTIKLIDLRKNQVSATLSADGFRAAADWTRAVFSPNGEYVMAGSSDGHLFVWNVAKNNVAKVLHGHQHAVMACSWNPTGNSLLSCDKQRSVVYWADF